MIKLALLATLCLLLTSHAVAHAQGPGFRGGRGGDPRFAADRDDFHYLLGKHDQVRREVKQIDGGVQTLTESDDPAVTATIQRHVAAMYDRLEQNRPLRMWDPLFQELFRHADQVQMKFEKTAHGVRVTETSDDPYVTSLIQAHAKVVSKFAERGFDEAHQAHPLPGEPAKQAGGHPESLYDAFVAFDKLYIPALALSNQQKLKPSIAALKKLRKAWDDSLAAQLMRAFPSDSAWPRDLSHVVSATALAGVRLDAEQTQEAHEALEPIRDLLMEARLRNGFDYPLDKLAEYHTTMEAIVKPATKMSPDEVTREQIERLQALVAQASRLWAEVERTNFQLDSFGKPAAASKKFASMIKAERAALAELADTLEAGQPEQVLQTAIAIKKPFAQVYMFFGDFPQPPAGE